MIEVEDVTLKCHVYELRGVCTSTLSPPSFDGSEHHKLHPLIDATQLIFFFSENDASYRLTEFQGPHYMALSPIDTCFYGWGWALRAQTFFQIA